MQKKKVERKFNIGLVGFGFIGTALCHAFTPVAKIKIYDKYKVGLDTLEDVVGHSEFIFLGLPTPAYEDNGEVDISILDENLEKIHNLVDENNDKIIVIKSTVPPGTTDGFAKKYPKLNLVMSPEFLTGISNKIDFICASRHIFGGNPEDTDRLEELFFARFGKTTKTFKTTRVAAELTKYASNLFFACKVTYFNYIYDVCQKLGLEYDEVKDMVFADNRIGRSHMSVPGSDLDKDGKQLQGFGNLCFPKDLASFIFYTKSLGLDAMFLQSVWDQNLKYRPDEDWKEIPGAFSERKEIKSLKENLNEEPNKDDDTKENT